MQSRVSMEELTQMHPIPHSVRCKGLRIPSAMNLFTNLQELSSLRYGRGYH